MGGTGAVDGRITEHAQCAAYHGVVRKQQQLITQHSCFAEMRPILKNANISRDDIGEFMYCYKTRHFKTASPCTNSIVLR